MSKINVVVTIKNKNDISEEKYIAIKNNKKITYQEKNCKTKILLDNFKIIRENEDYLVEMNFIPNKKTKGKYLLKENNNQIELEILTDYLIVEDNLILLKYKVITTEQDVIFKLECVK